MTDRQENKAPLYSFKLRCELCVASMLLSVLLITSSAAAPVPYTLQI